MGLLTCCTQIIFFVKRLNIHALYLNVQHFGPQVIIIQYISYLTNPKLHLHNFWSNCSFPLTFLCPASGECPHTLPVSSTWWVFPYPSCVQVRLDQWQGMSGQEQDKQTCPVILVLLILCDGQDEHTHTHRHTHTPTHRNKHTAPS